MNVIYGIVGLLAILFVVLVVRTIKLSRMVSPSFTPPFPLEEEEEHLFAERPHKEEKSIDAKPISQKHQVITHLMMNGTISHEEAKSMGITRLPMYIHRWRKHYQIDNIIVDGKFSHYKLIKHKG